MEVLAGGGVHPGEELQQPSPWRTTSGQRGQRGREEEEEVEELEESEGEESGGAKKSSTLAGDASDVPKSSATKQGLTLVGKERVSELVHESIATWYHSP